MGLLGAGTKLLCTVILLTASGFDPNLVMAPVFTEDMLIQCLMKQALGNTV